MRNRPSVRITVKVQPRAKVTSIDGKVGDAYKVRLTAPPVDGKANEACIRFIADRLGIPVSAVQIVSGLTGRTKILAISGVDPAAVERILLA